MGKAKAPPTVWTTKTIRFLLQKEVRRLFGVRESKRDTAIFLLAYRHDLGASEGGLLQVQDLDFTQQRIRTYGRKNSIAGVHPLWSDEAKAIKADLR
jgi:hypothetical protein